MWWVCLHGNSNGNQQSIALLPGGEFFLDKNFAEKTLREKYFAKFLNAKFSPQHDFPAKVFPPRYSMLFIEGNSRNTPSWTTAYDGEALTNGTPDRSRHPTAVVTADATTTFLRPVRSEAFSEGHCFETPQPLEFLD